MLKIKKAEDFGLGFNCMTRLYMNGYDEEILTICLKCVKNIWYGLVSGLLFVHCVIWLRSIRLDGMNKVYHRSRWRDMNFLSGI